MPPAEPVADHEAARDPAPPADPSFEDDCAACVGLCCVTLAFSRSRDFPFDKPAGVACRHLAGDHRCRVHAELRPLGFRGCVTYSCFGAGPLVTRAQAETTWRASPAAADRMFTAFGAVRLLQELRWYLRAAMAEPIDDAMRESLRRADAQTAALTADLATGRGPAPATGSPAEDQRDRVNVLLREASLALRGPSPGPDLAGADMVGARLRRADLRRASLRGAQLMGADLRGARLQRADLTGADLRNARLDGADLRGALFLTPAQVRSARGDAGTRLPAGLPRPGHWPT
jgi:uncharacterized protein YjbI with pentapeptide repeats